MNTTALRCRLAFASLFASATALFPNGNAHAVTQATLYVSPTGSGTAFSQTQPGSLTGARNQIRTINSAMTGDIIIYLYGGTYALGSSFQLQESSSTHDSGTNGHNVIYQAYPGQTPILSGGITVTGWSLFDSTKNIWQASVGTSVNSRQLYVNGVRAIRTRGPLNPGGFTATSSGYTASSSTMASWGNQANIEMVQRNDWKQLRALVSSISGTTITMQTPGWTYAHNSPTPGPPWNGNGTVSMNDVTWVENAYELLTGAGMWYLNRSTGFLYYIPRAGENMSTATVVLPTVEKLIDASGATSATPIHNVIFSGIAFEYATWLGPSTSLGYADNQAAILWFGPTNPLKTLGNISFQSSSNIQIANCTFLHLGGAAIDFGKGAHANSIIGNHIEDVSSTGIALGEVTDYGTSDSTQMTDSNTIKDNYIRKVGVDFEDAVGIWVGYAKNLVLSHNDIDNTPYSGVSVGWGWGTNSYATNNQILNNYVGRVMQTLQDGGSVYTLSAQTSSVETGNYYKNSGWNGIYFDEGTAYYTASNNVIDSCGVDWIAMWTPTIHDDTATNNFSNVTAFLNNGTNCTISNTTYVTGQSWPSVALSIIQNAGLESSYASLKAGEVFVNDTDPAYDHVPSDWYYSSARGFGDYKDDVHASMIDGEYVQYSFNGTGISYLGEINSDEGNVDVYLDGVFQTTVSCNYPTRLVQQRIYSVSNLSLGRHTLKLVKNGGTYFVLDGFVVASPETIVNDADPAYDHVPSDWIYSASRHMGDYSGDVHATATDGQYVQYTFSGTGISYIGELNIDEGNVDVYIDGVFQATVNCNYPTRVAQQRIFTASNLSAGTHSIKLVKNGGSYMVLDAFAVTGYGIHGSIVDEAESLIVAAQTSGVTYRIVSDSRFSGGAGSFFDATASGQYLTFDVPNITVGTYDVRVGLKNWNNKGIFQLAISRLDQQGSPTNVGVPVDQYNANEVFTEVDCGNWTPGTTSDKAFRFMVTGKNASSSGYGLAIDYIKLIPQ